MPWDHCSATLLDDDPCPTCGITKAQWTIQWNLTRTFQVKRKQIVRIALVGLDGAPVAHEPYRAVLGDAPAVEGALDDEGQARVELPAGVETARVTFPRRRGGVRRADAAVEADQLGAGVFGCAPGPRCRFRLAKVTEFVLVPRGGASLVGVRYTLRAGERRIEGRVGDDLVVRTDEVHDGVVTLDLDLPDGHRVLSTAPASDAPASDAPASDAPASDAPGWARAEHGEFDAVTLQREDG